MAVLHVHSSFFHIPVFVVIAFVSVQALATSYQVNPSEYAYRDTSVTRSESANANCRKYPSGLSPNVDTVQFIHCDGVLLKLADSVLGPEQYSSSDYYVWSAGTSEKQLLFIFPTTVTLTTITLHYYSDSARGLSRLRFYVVPDDHGIWDALTGSRTSASVAAVPPGGEPAGRRSVSINVNFNTKKVLMYKYSSNFQFAVSEVEFFTTNPGSMMTTTEPYTSPPNITFQLTTGTTTTKVMPTTVQSTITNTPTTPVVLGVSCKTVMPTEYSYKDNSVVRPVGESNNCIRYGSNDDNGDPIDATEYIRCHGNRLLTDSNIGPSQYDSSMTQVYLWTQSSPQQLLFVFPTTTSLTKITLYYYSGYYLGSHRAGLPRLRFYAVPDDFDVWDAVANPAQFSVMVTAVSPEEDQPAGRRSVTITFNSSTKKVLMVKLRSDFHLAVSEVEFFTCHGSMMTTTEPYKKAIPMTVQSMITNTPTTPGLFQSTNGESSSDTRQATAWILVVVYTILFIG